MKRTIAYDHRALTINGQRTFLWSGAMHYPRSTPAMWDDMMRRSADDGLNTIETYVFWNLHEAKRNVYDFSGRLDILRFCETAQKHNLNVLLRIGPYICAETNYGGFPAWLRDVPEINMRTQNAPFMREMERWVRFVCDYLKPAFVPNGGPIIAAQIENEYGMIAKNYGEPGQAYLKWSIDLAQSLNLNIPWIMCFGGMPGALETINSFWGHEKINAHQHEHPNQPLLWTETWSGWYDTWGIPHHIRKTENLAYGVARFIAQGGTGVNYYMWHGGTNFGREAMYLQTTSYDYDAPLDEFGLPTTKSKHLARLHRVLRPFEPLLLGSTRAQPQPIGTHQYVCSYRNAQHSLDFVINESEASAQVQHGGRMFALAPRSVVVWDGSAILFDTSEIDTSDTVTRQFAKLDIEFTTWQTWSEPLPELLPVTAPPPVFAQDPIEQLVLTKDTTDYCWYSTTFNGEGNGVLTLCRVADIAHVFVDGKLAGTSRTPLLEDRGHFESDAYAQKFELDLAPGSHRLDILCCAVGLIKGDWTIGEMNMAQERKGIWGRVQWNGRSLTNRWAMRAGLAGEKYWAENWATLDAKHIRKPLRWYRTLFGRPSGNAFALDLAAMTKGMAWINGQCIGRYWLVAGTGENAVFLQNSPVQDVEMGEPTQRYYHVPAEWLRERNELIVFEELSGDPTQVALCGWG